MFVWVSDNRLCKKNLDVLLFDRVYFVQLLSVNTIVTLILSHV